MTATEERAAQRNPRDGMPDRQILRTRGWQVASIDANAPSDRELHVRLTEQRGSAVVLSVCAPAVFYQFRTVPTKQPKRRKVPFSESARGKFANKEFAAT